MLNVVTLVVWNDPLCLHLSQEIITDLCVKQDPQIQLQSNEGQVERQHSAVRINNGNFDIQIMISNGTDADRLTTVETDLLIS